MARLLCFVLLVLTASPASAEVVRVAVTRGARITVEGAHLVVRSGAGPDLEAEESLEIDAVGPFASTGDRLDSRFTIEEATGGALRLNGVAVIGGGEVAAVNGTLVGIDAIDLERYVASVVGREMPSGWPMAALEAQAIAARTYVLSRRHSAKAQAAYDVEATVTSQAYGGHASIDERTVTATNATRGQVVLYDDALADTFFFASCSGKTELASNAFGTAGAPYLVSTTCETGPSDPSASWKRVLPIKQASKLLRSQGTIGDELEAIEVAHRTSTGRVASVRLRTARGNRAIPASDLRRLLGYASIPSLDLDIESTRADVRFTGHGSGHGVGLCQWGAREMAARGTTASDILQHYYPGTRIGSMPEVADRRP